MTNKDGSVVRKLTQKIRLSSGPDEIACTNLYLSDAEWALFRGLSARSLRKVRHTVEQDGYRIAIDEFEDGKLLAEIDDSVGVPKDVPSWLGVSPPKRPATNGGQGLRSRLIRRSDTAAAPPR